MVQGVVNQNAEGHIFSANAAAERILGLTLDQMLGRASTDPRWKAIHENGSDFPGDTHPAMATLRTGKEVRSVIMGVFHPGENEYHWININAIPRFKHGETKPHQVYTTFEDITENKRAEEKLRESEEKYRILAETIQEGIWSIDKEGNTTFVNPRMAQMLGYTTEEMLGKHLFSFMSESQVPIASALMERRAQGIKELHDFEFLRKDGSTIFALLETGPLTDEKGNTIGAIAGVTDISERKIRELEYQTILHASIDGFAMLDMQARFLDVNDAYCRLLGYSRDEFLKLSFPDIELLENPEEMTERLRRIKKVGGERFESCQRHKDGKIIYLDISISYLPAGDGRIIAFVRDLTARKRAEEETLALERKAQISSRLASIGEMAAGIAHEINNPLTPILGFADMLLKRDLPVDIKADLRIIRDSAKRTADVTRRLLTFARQYKPMRTLCNINEVVETVLQLRAYHLKTTNIKVITELTPELPQTMADAGQLQQVFINLIMNAEYEMSRTNGGGNLLIKTKKMGNIVRILVKDDGPGISKENMEKLFTPFFSTKKVGEGTGLGLSVCHGVIAEHKGIIYAESKVGEGATFVVELPLISQQKEEDAKPSESDTPEAGKAVKARILVVDDEPTIVQVLKRVLTDEGYEVKATDKAKEALRMIKSGKYALILLDIKLPDMSGIELYQHLDKTDKSSTQRIIFITGDVMGTDTIDFLSRIGAACINKPFDIEQLRKEVKSKLLQRE